MNPYLAYAAFLCLSSLLVGLLIGRRFLDRTQRTKCQALAQDLTDKVHDRCDAYRRLEDRISCAIGDFDRREAELRGELMGEKPRLSANPAAMTAAPTGTTAASGDALAWMDDCSGGCDPLPPTMPETEIADRLNAIEGSATNVEGQVDAFSTRIADAQEQSHLMLLRQSRAIEELERRLRGLETSAARPTAPVATPAPKFAPPAPARAPAPAREIGRNAELETIVANIERSQRDLLEWQARAATSPHEPANVEPTFAAPLEAGMDECAGCLRARELAREILDLVPGIVPAPKPAPAPTSERPAPETSRVRELEQRLSGIQGEVESLRTARESSREERSRYSDEISKRDAHVADLEKRLQGLQSELSRAGQALHGNRSQITQLMQTLEETKARADARDRLLEEQKSHVSAAYAMLDRMRPLLHAIESTPPAPGRHA
jgi:TolA-binding protein